MNSVPFTADQQQPRIVYKNVRRLRWNDEEFQSQYYWAVPQKMQVRYKLKAPTIPKVGLLYSYADREFDAGAFVRLKCVAFGWKTFPKKIGAFIDFDDLSSKNMKDFWSRFHRNEQEFDFIEQDGYSVIPRFGDCVLSKALLPVELVKVAE